MKYYAIYKTDEKKKSEEIIVLKGGYSFRKKTMITLYDDDVIRNILITKLNNSLKGIIDLYLLTESDDESGDGRNETDILMPKIELMRSLLLGKYASFLSKREIENYLNKLEKMEKKIGMKQSKKSRSL